MAFFIVPIDYHERASGEFRPDAAEPSEAYPTREAAETAATATAARRARHRQAWSEAYEEPFPGDDRIVEAASPYRARLFVWQVLRGRPPSNPFLILGGMPPEVRAAYERTRDEVAAPAPLGDDPSQEELDAHYRQRRASEQWFWRNLADLQRSGEWLRTHQPPETWR